ncbi:serine/threonine-protein kinase [Ramlibacter tataouinensis]|uniref:serine/threonine-protein kinase n=1 Tax=Ramlibacter tataouinensis TaxID=94132 RepID=UPI0022F3C957|nr:serine/threonine-protein kinase [Ramlibacter tataouinensis]WBY01749.1 serine/threonine-protein kinase [Ramlibacter tataouinensis]
MHLKKLGRYELVRVLGKGAMGVVYEGRDPNLDRRVALKTIMVDGLSGDAAAEYESRFRTEARSAARLQHPNIVTVHDSDRDGDTAFLVMEYIQGEDLKQHLDRGKRHSLGEALRLLHDLLAALEFAHRQGVVHRDIKPANLLVEEGGSLKLTDFGVARITGEATRTQGSMIGTLKYMAPEQVQGLKVDARADLFSAGVVAYQLLTGTRPFDGDNDFSIIQQVIGHTPPPPTSLAPLLPAAVDAVLARALAKNRDERFQSAAEFSQALREAFAGMDAGALASVQSPAPASPAAAPTAPLSRPALTVPGAPITQELELEYWRDVRDATDARELEGFLARFPQGIYADLARRRLERLTSTSDDPERTVLHGMTRPPRPAHAQSEPAPAIESPVPAASAAAAPADETPTPPHAPAPQPVPVPVASGSAPAPNQSRPRRGVLWAAAAAAGLAVAVVLIAGRAGGPVETQAAASEAASSVAPAASAAVLPAAAVAVAASAAAAPVAARATKPAASGAPVPRSAAASVAARRAAPADTAPSAAEPPAPAAATDKPESTAAVQQATRPQGQRLVPPGETCGDKFFLAREFCLQSECAKPGYQNFPACQKLREQARLREESKVRN